MTTASWLQLAALIVFIVVGTRLLGPYIAGIYRVADLFLLTAKAETQPIVLLESMASHTPFLTTDVGCVTELPGGTVVRSEPEMVEELKALMASPERRRQLAEEGWAAATGSK